MNVYFELLRIKQYPKNILVFLGILLSTNIFFQKFFEVLFVFFLFCISSSIVYVYNDIKDVNKDKLHPKKKLRPLPSGKITVKKAFFILYFLIFLDLLFFYIFYSLFNNFLVLTIILFYVVFNFFYSSILKNIPIVDVFSIALSFILRIFAGTYGVNVYFDKLLFLSVFFGSLFFAFDKRRIEFFNNKKHRKVFKKYNSEFLTFSVFFNALLTIFFYSLYVFLKNYNSYGFSIVVLNIIFLRYFYISFLKEKNKTHFENFVYDKQMIFFIMLFLILISLKIY